jgi:hypothetical protein
MTALIRLPALFLLLPMAACEPGLPTALDGGHTFGGGNKVELVADSDAGGGATGSGNAQSTTDGRGGHGFGSGSGVGTIGSGNGVEATTAGGTTERGGGFTFGGSSRSVFDDSDGSGGFGSGHASYATGGGFGSGTRSERREDGGWTIGSGGRSDTPATAPSSLSTAGGTLCGREEDSGGWTIGSGGGAPGAGPCEVR